jgi:enoyl-CoA hydratase/carnithine racemase
VARVILNKPIQRNPLSKDVLQKLHSVVDEVVASLASADRVRAIILSSTGTVFSAGHDFSEFVLEEGNEEGCLREHADILTLCTELNLRLQRECPPTIAAVDGLATAAGCQLVASCDLVFATRYRLLLCPPLSLWFRQGAVDSSLATHSIAW